MEKFFLFAGDQKIEHLNKDFYGPGIPHECGDPEHLFKIASKAPISAFATQLGLIKLYGGDYKQVPYVVKLNSRTDLVPTSQRDPLSRALHTIEDVLDCQSKMGLNIVGVGYTVYLGSEYEHEMLAEAARLVYDARKVGLGTILWMYPRGKAIENERDANLIAGAAGVGACLGADFVKVNLPEGGAKALVPVVRAAGRTGVLCSGGEKIEEEPFLQELRAQVSEAGVAGCAVGRNIHQKPLDLAVAFCKKIAAIFRGE